MDMQLVAQTRSKPGKGAARRLRQQELIPAVCYGCNKETRSLSVSNNQFQKLIREVDTETRVIPLNIEDAGTSEIKHVMVREIQLDPVKHKILHIDFLEVDMNQPIVVEVPIELTGEAAGITLGGLLNHIRHTLTVRSLPGDIPERLKVDITHLNIGDSLHVADIKSMVSVEVIDEDHYTVVTIGAPAAAAASSEEEEPIEEGEEVTEEN
jgi:large subunit ribosomal protein L25